MFENGNTFDVGDMILFENPVDGKTRKGIVIRKPRQDIFIVRVRKQEWVTDKDHIICAVEITPSHLIGG